MAKICKMKAEELFDAEFYQKCLTFFTFEPPAELPQAASLVVIAVPRPQTRIYFTRDDKTVMLLLPPTYRGYKETRTHTLYQLNAWLAAWGYRAVSTRLPEKSATAWNAQPALIAIQGCFHKAAGEIPGCAQRPGLPDLLPHGRHCS